MRKLVDLALQLLIDCRQLFVDRMQLFAIGLELLGRRTQLLVHRLQLFVAGLQLFGRRFVLFDRVAQTPLHLVETITRADLEKLVDDLIKRTLEPCRKALKDAGVTGVAVSIDTTRAVASLIVAGTLRRNPNLRLILAHAGGTAPYVRDRILDRAPILRRMQRAREGEASPPTAEELQAG